MFKELIVTPDDYKRAIDAIGQDKHTPTVLYGAGIYAAEVEKFLRFHSVNVVGCFVDDEYLVEGATQVLSFSEIKATYDSFNIVIAFCGDSTVARKKIADLKCDQIAAVRFFDCRFWERFGSLNLEYLHQNIDSFQRVYDWFADDLSKRTFVSYINTKLTYDSSLIPVLRSSTQYFPEDLPVFSPSKDDVFIDGGAYTGDTLSVFLAKTDGLGCKKYFAFEPDERNAARLSSFIRDKDLQFVEVLQRGLWSRADTLRFQGASHTRSLITDTGDVEIKVGSIDDLDVEPSFIKMDIEGAELDALVGASATIKKCRPKLAIALYHYPHHLVDIPNFIKTLCPDYRFYLRIHSFMSEELVLYAVAQ